MRIVGNIPNPSFKITVFSYNMKFIVKIETGPMSQEYKLGEDEVSGLGDIRQILSEDFLRKVKVRFDEMFKDWNAAIEKNLQ